MSFFEQNGKYLIYVAGIVVFSLVWMIVANKRNKGKKKGYLEKYPDAARVFLTSKTRIASEAVSVYLVDDEIPVLFTEGLKSGFYVKAGISIIEISYSHTRPGVIYKSVTSSTGSVKQQIETEPYKSYILGFDKKEEEFTFSEIDTMDI